MKKLKAVQIGILFLGILLVLSLAAGLLISDRISNSVLGEYFYETKEEALFHLMVIVDEQNLAYGEDFVRGLEEASQEGKVAIEFLRLSSSDYSGHLIDALDKAMYAKVDGVIMHAFFDEALAQKVNELAEKEIPVITMNEDLARSQRISYVGINRYHIGQAAGIELAKAMNGVGKIAVIEQKNYATDNEGREDMLLLGIMDVIKAYPELSLEFIRYTEQGVLSAETVATKIFRENEEINGIFCTELQNTLGVVQVLIDNNLVNQVSLVGVGEDEEILSYINKGKIIDASIVLDYEDIGRKAIETFLEFKQFYFVPSYTNTELQVVNEGNIESYLDKVGDENGED